MSIIDEALSANVTIANGYDPSRVKPPAPKIAIVTCADPRLTIIEKMLGLAEGDVRPMFREKDRDSMLKRFDLWSHSDVQAHQDAILERLRNGTMPCDGA